MGLKYLLVLFLAAPAAAKDYKFNKQVDPGPLSTQLTAAGIKLDYISCVGTSCIVHNASADPSKAIAAYVYVDPNASAASSKAQIKTLVTALRAGTATQAQKDQLLSLLVQTLLGQ